MPPEPSRWQTRDYLAATVLAFGTAATVLHQNLHLAVLWDLSYTLDTAFRISLGQVPYRDFPLAHAPLTFLIQALIIKLTGRVYWHHALYAALAGAAATLLTWRILVQTLHSRPNARLTAFLLALPLTVLGNYCILPFPSYDCDSTLAILVAVYALQRLNRTDENLVAPSMPSHLGHGWAATNARALLTGATLALPLFFKQNIGLPFLATALAALTLLTAINLYHHKPTRTLILTLTGAVATLILALTTIHFTAGLGNYLYWTITFARQRRLPGLHDMLDIYTDPTLLWTLPTIAIAFALLHLRNKRGAPGPDSRTRVSKMLGPIAFLLLTLPFLNTLLSLPPTHDADDRAAALLTLWPLILLLAAAQALYNLRKRPTLNSLTPFLLLAAINGTLLSQQLWGSTYAIWPLLLLLLANLLTALPRAPVISTGVPNKAVISTDIPNKAVISTGVPNKAVISTDVPNKAVISTEAKRSGETPVFVAPLNLALTATIAATLLLTGFLYTTSEERLTYAKITPEAGPPAHSTLPALGGLTTPGPYLPAFDELVRYTRQNIPQNDPIILLNGEDPFYFATGRTPKFPILLFDPATDPYTPQTLLADAHSHNVHWLILKRHLQINQDPMPYRDASIASLLTEFTPYSHLSNYDIYHRP
jgi:hypothetical protein